MVGVDRNVRGRLFGRKIWFGLILLRHKAVLAGLFVLPWEVYSICGCTTYCAEEGMGIIELSGLSTLEVVGGSSDTNTSFSNGRQFEVTQGSSKCKQSTLFRQQSIFEVVFCF